MSGVESASALLERVHEPEFSPVEVAVGSVGPSGESVKHEHRALAVEVPCGAIIIDGTNALSELATAAARESVASLMDEGLIFSATDAFSTPEIAEQVTAYDFSRIYHGTADALRQAMADGVTLDKVAQRRTRSATTELVLCRIVEVSGEKRAVVARIGGGQVYVDHRDGGVTTYDEHTVAVQRDDKQIVHGRPKLSGFSSALATTVEWQDALHGVENLQVFSFPVDPDDRIIIPSSKLIPDNRDARDRLLRGTRSMGAAAAVGVMLGAARLPETPRLQSALAALPGQRQELVERSGSVAIVDVKERLHLPCEGLAPPRPEEPNAGEDAIDPSEIMEGLDRTLPQADELTAAVHGLNTVLMRKRPGVWQRVKNAFYEARDSWHPRTRLKSIARGAGVLALAAVATAVIAGNRSDEALESAPNDKDKPTTGPISPPTLTPTPRNEVTPRSTVAEASAASVDHADSPITRLPQQLLQNYKGVAYDLEDPADYRTLYELVEASGVPKANVMNVIEAAVQRARHEGKQIIKHGTAGHVWYEYDEVRGGYRVTRRSDVQTMTRILFPDDVARVDNK